MYKYTKISPYKIRKILTCFINDETAQNAVKITHLNRKTISRYYQLFRTQIALLFSSSTQIEIKDIQTLETFPLFEIIYEGEQIDVQPIFHLEKPNEVEVSPCHCKLYKFSQSKRFLLKNFDISSPNSFGHTSSQSSRVAFP